MNYKEMRKEHKEYLLQEKIKAQIKEKQEINDIINNPKYTRKNLEYNIINNKGCYVCIYPNMDCGEYTQFKYFTSYGVAVKIINIFNKQNDYIVFFKESKGLWGYAIKYRKTIFKNYLLKKIESFLLEDITLSLFCIFGTIGSLSLIALRVLNKI